MLRDAGELDRSAAVLDPPDTTELYFVANGSGGHAFASTYEAHLRNVARLRQLEQREGQGSPDEAAGPPPQTPSTAVN